MSFQPRVSHRRLRWSPSRTSRHSGLPSTTAGGRRAPIAIAPPTLAASGGLSTLTTASSPTAAARLDERDAVMGDIPVDKAADPFFHRGGRPVAGDTLEAAYICHRRF